MQIVTEDLEAQTPLCVLLCRQMQTHFWSEPGASPVLCQHGTDPEQVQLSLIAGCVGGEPYLNCSCAASSWTQISLTPMYMVKLLRGRQGTEMDFLTCDPHSN